MEENKPRIMLDYREMKNKFTDFITSKENAVMVLATSCDNCVQSRTVLIMSDGTNIYLFTWKYSRKCKQIQRNPNVSLCKDNVHFEGVAEIIGGFNEEGAKRYTEIFRATFPGVIEKWEQRPNMLIIRVKPTIASIGGSDETPRLDFIDFEKGVAFSEEWACY